MPQVVDAVVAPVIAGGGIGDARGIAAAFVVCAVWCATDDRITDWVLARLAAMDANPESRTSRSLCIAPWPIRAFSISRGS